MDACGNFLCRSSVWKIDSVEATLVRVLVSSSGRRSGRRDDLQTRAKWFALPQLLQICPLAGQSSERCGYVPPQCPHVRSFCCRDDRSFPLTSFPLEREGRCVCTCRVTFCSPARALSILLACRSAISVVRASSSSCVSVMSGLWSDLRLRVADEQV